MAFLDEQKLKNWISDTFHGLPKGIIFDLDGVIIDSWNSNLLYYNKVRRYFGLPDLSEEMQKYVHVATYSQALNAIVPPALQPFIKDAVAQMDYHRDFLSAIEIFPGLHDFLLFCVNEKIKLAMHTNNIQGVDYVLKKFHLEGIFQPVVTAAVALPKPSPEGVFIIIREWNFDPKEIFFLGDGTTDRDAALSASVHFLSFRSESLFPYAVENYSVLLTAFQKFKH